MFSSVRTVTDCMFSAWTLVSLYNIASQDAQEDFTFVDEDDDSHMTWAEITVETYDVDPNDKYNMFQIRKIICMSFWHFYFQCDL